MCLGIPGRVVGLADGYAGQVAVVDVEGAERKVNVGMLEAPPAPGDWVLIHMGFAVEAIDEAAARTALCRPAADGQRPAPPGCAAATTCSGSCRASASGRSSTSPPRSWGWPARCRTPPPGSSSRSRATPTPSTCSAAGWSTTPRPWPRSRASTRPSCRPAAAPASPSRTAAPAPAARSRPRTSRSATTASPSSPTRSTGATGTRSSPARTAVRGSRSSPRCPTTGPPPPWPASRCAPPAARSTTTPATGASTRSPSRAPTAVRRSRLVAPGLHETGDAAVRRARELLADGRVVAVKGLGGYHLACDARNEDGGRGAAAAQAARRQAVRGDGPRPRRGRGGWCDRPRRSGGCSPAAASPSSSSPAPSRQPWRSAADPRPDTSVAEAVAPGNPDLGVLLPYTPLHVLLLGAAGDPGPDVLVMTSGNLSGEPIVTDDEEARDRLGDLADAFLVHDRPIQVPCDDSVARVVAGVELPVRRSRGHAPLPVRPARSTSTPVLATGADLKNTCAVAAGRYAWLSQHVGDLDDLATQDALGRVRTAPRGADRRAARPARHRRAPRLPLRRLGPRARRGARGAHRPAPPRARRLGRWASTVSASTTR